MDRLDSMVIVSGENVYPAEIEDVVPQLDGMADGVVAALPHPVTGVELVLVYTLLPGAVVRDDEWRALLMKQLSRLQGAAPVRAAQGDRGRQFSAYSAWQDPTVGRAKTGDREPDLSHRRWRARRNGGILSGDRVTGSHPGPVVMAQQRRCPLFRNLRV